MGKIMSLLLFFSCLGQGLLQVACQQIDSDLYDSEALSPDYISTEASVVFDRTTYAVGDTIFGYRDYILLIVGDTDCPLLLGVPHDGTEVGDPEIPETSTTGRDIYTKPLTATIASSFKSETGLQPWIIINEISRKRVDPNTYPDDVSGRYTDSEALSTYESYHELLQFARSTIAAAQSSGNGGLFVDIHGHAHKYADDHEELYTSVLTGNSISSSYIDQTEVGYGLTNYSLEQSDSYIDTLSELASIYAIATEHSGVDFSELIRGPYSFGSLLEEEGVHAVPSDEMPILERDSVLFGLTSSAAPARRPYFNGGFCTRKYGTIASGSTTGSNDNISAVQIETPGITVRNNASIRAVSGPRIKRAIIKYLNYWYGYSYTNSL